MSQILQYFWPFRSQNKKKLCISLRVTFRLRKTRSAFTELQLKDDY
jgi:hypothetical protein